MLNPSSITPRFTAALTSFIIGAAITCVLWTGIGSIRWGMLKVVDHHPATWQVPRDSEIPASRWQRGTSGDVKFVPSSTLRRSVNGSASSDSLVDADGNGVVDSYPITIIDPLDIISGREGTPPSPFEDRLTGTPRSEDALSEGGLSEREGNPLVLEVTEL